MELVRKGLSQRVSRRQGTSRCWTRTSSFNPVHRLLWQEANISNQQGSAAVEVTGACREKGAHTGQMLALAAGDVIPQGWRCCRGSLRVPSRAHQIVPKSALSSRRHLGHVFAVVCMAASPQGDRRLPHERSYCMDRAGRSGPCAVYTGHTSTPACFQALEIAVQK